MFSPMKTNDAAAVVHKTLLYAHHGFGKTYQYRHMARAYGKGFIISGESGLSSIADCEIDYLPFSSWDGEHDPAKGVFSFVGIINMMKTKEFQDAGYNWIGVDSVTEMSERCFSHFQKKHEGSRDGFVMWADYERAMIGYLKWLRDLPYHVLITCLAAEETDDNGATHYWPMVRQKKVAKLLPSLYDHVYCGLRKAVPDPRDTTGTTLKVARFLVTDEVQGWHGKTRDPRQRLSPVERCADVTILHKRIAMTEEEYADWLSANAIVDQAITTTEK